MNKGKVNQGHGARFQATQHMGSLPASAPPPTPVYHVTVWRQLTFAEAEITASLHHLALWTEGYARNTAQQAVGADPWK